MTENTKIETADSLQSNTQRKYGFMGQQNPEQLDTQDEEQNVKSKYGFMDQKESGDSVRRKHGFMGTDDKNNIETLFGMK